MYRPIDPGIFALTLGWFILALGVGGCLIFIATHGQSLAGKLLYTVGGLCLLTVPASVAFSFMLIAWYGGKPDARASVDGRFCVREKQRLTPVSQAEFRWLERVHANDNWFVRPCVVGAGCIGFGRLLRPRGRVTG